MNGLPIEVPGLHPTPATLESIVHTYGNKVYQVAFHLTGSSTDAEDVLQEVFFKLYRNWVYVSNIKNLEAWLRRVTVNAAMDLHRSRRCRPRPAQGAGIERSVPWSDPVEQKELHEKLEDALAALPPRQLAALILFDHEGLSAREAGEILGITDAAVRSYVFEARRKVKDLLAPYLRGNR